MSGFLFTTTSDGTTSIYSSDGTVAGTEDLDVSRFDYATNAISGTDFTPFAGHTLFLGGSGTGSMAYDAVYRTDGTSAGTTPSVINGAGGADAESGLWVLGDAVLTSGSTGLASYGLYASPDGVNFSEIETGAGARDITVSGSLGYFAGISESPVGSGTISAGLWCTDGTAAGTQQITVPGQSLDVVDIVSLGRGKVVFFNQDQSGAIALWTTDGTSAGTVPISNDILGSNLGTVAGGATAGGKAYFVADAADGVASLWATDGTSAGTVKLLGGEPGSPHRAPSIFGSWNGKLLASSGYGLYVSDGTTGGTVELGGGNPDDAIEIGDKIFLASTDPTGAATLWASDGTFTGTVQVQVPGLQAITGSLNAVGNDVVFEGTDESGKQALFESDGTQAGSHELSLPTGIVLDSATVIAPLPTSVVTLGGGNQTYEAPPDTVVRAGAGADTVVATSGQVTVTGSSGQLVFIGGSASSSVSGGAGSTTLFGGAGGGAFIGGSAGHNVLVSEGAAGTNTSLTGAAAGDQLFGSAQGNDLLAAGPGRESVLGGGGNTTIDGGAAADVIFAGSGPTTVNGAAPGGDTVVGSAGALTVTAQHGEAVFGGAGALDVTASTQGADSIIGGKGAINVAGRGANMLVVDSTSVSNISTGNGAALIFTSAGSSTITGGTGSLQAVLGAGNTAIYQGGGASTYDVVQGAAGGTDVLRGFNPARDRIDLFGYSQSQVSIATAGGSSVVSLADGTKIQVIGVGDLGQSLVG